MRRVKYVGLSETFKFVVLLLLVCIFLSATNILWRWDQLIYDAYQRFTTRPAPEDIIIIAIDEDSLEQLGRWPWRRNLHAELINILSRENARVIAFDVIFAEPDGAHPQDDAALIKSVRASGKVVLPVLVEQPRSGGILRETLPLPKLTKAAAALGHVHVELDADGIARSVYLMEGLGGPHWPALAVAVLRFMEPDQWTVLSGMRRDADIPVSPLLWVRDYHVKIPYFGPPGHFQSISYQQVLTGNYPADLFKNRIVLVGVTATGLGDSLPTPVSGLSQAMPGVEINANILAGLRAGSMIKDMSQVWLYTVSIILVLIPVLVYPLVRPRIAALSLMIMIMTVVLVSALCLYLLQIWFPPAPVIVTLILSYPFWSWRRLEYTLRYMDAELALLNSERDNTNAKFIFNPEYALEFMRQWQPLTGLIAFDEQGVAKYQWGVIPTHPMEKISLNNKWSSFHDYEYWYGFVPTRYRGYFGITWNSELPPDEWQTKHLFEFLEKINSTESPQPQNAYEIIQARTQQVHEATRQLGDLKKFVEDTLNQMADGVIVVDCFGQIILSNKQSRKFLTSISGHSLSGAWIEPLLQKISLTGQKNWQSILSDVFQNNSTVQFQTRIGETIDLLVSVSPMHFQNENYTDALVISMSDITRLVDSERRRKETLSFLSHDLRSPLVSILALTELMATNSAAGVDEKSLERIEKHARRTIELAEDFVQFSRIDGNEDIAFSEVDLIDIASNAIDQLWDQSKAKSIKIKRRFDSTECLINGNAQLLERVFINILSNSIKYSSNETEITFKLSCNNEHVICNLADQGYGISAEELPYVFDRFRRVQDKQNAGIWGVGLGLAFVKLVIERHNGTIQIKSHLGSGTKIEIKLPR